MSCVNVNLGESSQQKATRLPSPHLCLLLRLGRRFTLKEIRQPLLCFVEWIKTWKTKRDSKSDSSRNIYHLSLPRSSLSSRNPRDMLPFRSFSSQPKEQYFHQKDTTISSSSFSPCSGLTSGSGSGTLLCEDVSAITGGGGLGCRGSESSQAASARPRTSECRL